MTATMQNGNHFFDYFIKKHDSKLRLTGNLNQADVAGLNIQDTFTTEVIEILSNLNYEENPTQRGNFLIRIENQPIFYRNWSHAGVNQVRDILCFLSLTILNLTIKLRPPF